MNERSPTGHKPLTLENWTQADPVMHAFGGYDLNTGQFQSIDRDLWARQVLACNLVGAVPREVHRLFDVARGTMLYAYFFYPVMTLAAEQLYRVVDAALAARMSHRGRRLTFAARIEAAIQEGVIPKQDEIRWNATRHLRNIASHAEKQSIYAPGMALNTLAIATEQINRLFDRTS